MKDQHYDPFSEKKKGLFHRHEKAPEEKETKAKAMAEALNENLHENSSDVPAFHESGIQKEIERESATEDISVDNGTEGVEKISEPMIERADEKISEPFIERAEENPFEEKTSEGDTQAVPSAKAPLRRRKYPVSAMVSAGFWIRTVAFTIDAAVAAAFASIFASPITAFFLTDGSLAAKAFSGFFFYLYFVLSTYLTNGQTLGKMIAGIRVIHPDEPRLSLTTVIVREGFCRFIQTTFLLLYIITAFSERKQNLGDFLCDTFVVKDALYLVEKDEGDLFYAYEN